MGLLSHRAGLECKSGWDVDWTEIGFFLDVSAEQELIAFIDDFFSLPRGSLLA